MKSTRALLTVRMLLFAVMLAGVTAAVPSVALAQQQRMFQGEITVIATSASAKFNMAPELVADVSRFREVSVLIRVSKTSGLQADPNDTTIKLQTAMQPVEGDWLSVGTGASVDSGDTTFPFMTRETLAVTDKTTVQGDKGFLRYLRWQVAFSSGVSAGASVTFSIEIIGHM